MSKLAALKKQIAALEAQAERIAKEEMSSAIAKVKDIMAEFNLTIEHLTQSVAAKRVAKKMKAKKVSVAKYADPKTGKTWSGFGRAPNWIAGAKSRDAFLAGKSAAANPVKEAPAVPKRAVKAVKVAKQPAKAAAKKAGAAVKKASSGKATAVAAKKKAAAKKTGPKATASNRAAAVPVQPTTTPAA